MQARGVAVVSRVLGIFEAFDFGVCDEEDGQTSLLAKGIEQGDELAPVSKCVDIALAIAAIGLLDRLDPIIGANSIVDEPFEPVEGIDC